MKRTRLKRENIAVAATQGWHARTIVLLVAISLFFVSSTLGNTNFAGRWYTLAQQLTQACNYLIIALLLLILYMFLLKRLQNINILACILLFCLFMPVFYMLMKVKYQALSFISYFLLMVACVCVPYELKILRTLFIGSVCKIGFVLVVFMLGIAQDNPLTRTQSTGVVLRRAFGFVSPNTLGIAILSAAIFYLMLKESRTTIFDLILLLFVSIVVDMYIDSRLFLLVSLLAIIIFFLYKYNAYPKGRLFAFFLSIIPIIFLALSWFCVIPLRTINHDLWSQLDTLLAGRLQYAAYAVEQFGVSLFGTQMEYVSRRQNALTGEQWFGVDNSYMHLILDYGIITAVLFCIFISWLMYRCWQNRFRVFTIGSVVFLTMALTENTILAPATSALFLLAFGFHGAFKRKNSTIIK